CPVIFTIQPRPGWAGLLLHDTDRWRTWHAARVRPRSCNRAGWPRYESDHEENHDESLVRQLYGFSSLDLGRSSTGSREPHDGREILWRERPILRWLQGSPVFCRITR